MIPITERPPKLAPAPRRLALFELGFRPFYLLAALFAAASVFAWVGTLHGMPWHGALSPLAWHQHEMLFGFALAVIAGFLLTAGRAWTGLATPVRWPLALLCVHWLAARVLLLTGPWLAAALVDASFPFVLAVVLANVLVRAHNRRNYFAVALLGALGLADVGFFLEQAGAIRTAGMSVMAGLYLVTTLVTVMGGRVVPAFTASALPQARVMRSPRLGIAALVLTLAAFIAALADLPAWYQVPLAGIAALAQVWQQARWVPLATLGRPILWIMHLSYAWIPVGLALLALSSLGWVSPSASAHAFGAGAVGGMIIAMITRTALGHTGRPLRVGAAETIAYLCIHCAALARVIASLVPGAAYMPFIGVAALLWSAGFLVYCAVYTPRLALPRVDGKPG
jgi:uncharacterized protein involved in response to NO